MNFFKSVKKLNKFILDVLFPIKCVGCKEKNEIICDNCLSTIPRTDRETENNIFALFDYRNQIIKKAIWELKYHHKRYLGEKLGQLLYESFIEEIGEMKIYVPGRSIFVIPVPISYKKTKIRGYNQAFAIAKGFCNQTDSNILELKDKIVTKKIDTLPQAKITNKKRRLENIKGIFQIKNEEQIRGRTVIVIDDVTTTGGTLGEMMKVLKKAQAKKVIGLAVAH